MPWIDNQKRRFIANLLQEMKKAGQLTPDGVSRWARWRLLNRRRKRRIRGDFSQEIGRLPATSLISCELVYTKAQEDARA